MRRHPASYAPVALAGALLVLSGCATAPPTENVPRGRMTLYVTAGADVSEVVGRVQGRRLSLDRVAIVIQDLELEGETVEECVPDDGSPNDTGCEEFARGPILLEVPLDGSLAEVLTVDVPVGVYDEFEFDIHATGHDGGRHDLALLQDYPEMARVSMRIEGTYDGEPFLFTVDYDEEQEAELSPPLVVMEGGIVGITLLLDVARWFDSPQGLVDPRQAMEDGPFEDLVEDNIERTTRAFRDDDGDGRPDD